MNQAATMTKQKDDAEPPADDAGTQGRRNRGHQVEVDPGLMRNIKILAAHREVPMKQWINEVLAQAIKAQLPEQLRRAGWPDTHEEGGK